MPSRELWSNLIDYAGVFPPAQHPLATALSRYRRALADPDGWILGPCLVKASQLTSIEDPPGRLGAVLDVNGPLVAGPPLQQIEMRIDPANPGDSVQRVNEAAERAGVVYLESNRPEDIELLDLIASMRQAGRSVRAKIRTGGVTADSFPPVASVAAFIRRCVELEVPFKATAGLHHPIRRVGAVKGAIEHGFINILAAVRVALSGSPERVTEVLGSTEYADFDFPTATWRGVGIDVPDELIRGVFVSFGSCSFSEPSGYLRELGVLTEMTSDGD